MYIIYIVIYIDIYPCRKPMQSQQAGKHYLEKPTGPRWILVLLIGSPSSNRAESFITPAAD